MKIGMVRLLGCRLVRPAFEGSKNECAGAGGATRVGGVVPIPGTHGDETNIRAPFADPPPAPPEGKFQHGLNDNMKLDWTDHYNLPLKTYPEILVAKPAKIGESVTFPLNEANDLTIQHTKTHLREEAYYEQK